MTAARTQGTPPADHDRSAEDPRVRELAAEVEELRRQRFTRRPGVFRRANRLMKGLVGAFWARLLATAPPDDQVRAEATGWQRALLDYTAEHGWVRWALAAAALVLLTVNVLVVVHLAGVL